MVRFLKIALIFIFFDFFAFSDDVPLWIRSRSLAFPRDEFISATGTGKNEAEARENALSAISMFFGVNVRVEKSSDFFANEENGNVSKNRLVNEKTSVSSEIALPSVHFTNAFFSHGDYSVCAYVLKETAIFELSSEANRALEAAADFLSISQDSKDALSKNSFAKKAMLECEKGEKSAKSLSALDSKTATDFFEQFHSIFAQAQKSSESARRRLVFNVTESPESKDDGSALNALRQEAEVRGFSCSAHGFFEIRVLVSFEESENAIGKFVRPILSLRLFGEDGAVITSFSRSLPKCGHRTLEGAYEKARADIKKEIAEKVAPAFFD